MAEDCPRASPCFYAGGIVVAVWDSSWDLLWVLECKGYWMVLMVHEDSEAFVEPDEGFRRARRKPSSGPTKTFVWRNESIPLAIRTKTFVWPDERF